MSNDAIVAYQTEDGVLCARCAPVHAREFPLAATDLDKVAALGAIVCVGTCGDPWIGGRWLGMGSGLVEVDVSAARAESVRNQASVTYVPDAEAPAAYHTGVGVICYLCAPNAPANAREQLPIVAADLDKASALGATTCVECYGVWTGRGWMQGARWVEETPSAGEPPVRYQDLGLTAAEAARVVAYRTEGGLLACFTCAFPRDLDGPERGVTLGEIVAMSAAQCTACDRPLRFGAEAIWETVRSAEATRHWSEDVTIDESVNLADQHTYWTPWPNLLDRLGRIPFQPVFGPGGTLVGAEIALPLGPHDRIGEGCQVTMPDGRTLVAASVHDDGKTAIWREQGTSEQTEAVESPAGSPAGEAPEHTYFTVELSQPIPRSAIHSPDAWLVPGARLEAEDGRRFTLVEWRGATVYAQEVPPRRVARFRLSFDLFSLVYAPGRHANGYEVVENGLPADATLVDARFEYPDTVVCTIESAEFDAVAPGAAIPERVIICRRLEEEAATIAAFDMAERLELGRAAVVVLRSHTPIDRDRLRAAADELARSGLAAPESVLLALEPGQSIETLDEDRMRALGWVRAPNAPA